MGTGISGTEGIGWIGLEETKKAIREYVKNQLKEDMMQAQISLKEYENALKDCKCWQKSRHALAAALLWAVPEPIWIKVYYTWRNHCAP